MIEWHERGEGWAPRWYEAVVPVPQPESRSRAIAPTRITIEARPRYCDRGRWIAKCFSDPKDGAALDGQEGWPRYYFDLDVAKSEVAAWVDARLGGR